MVLTPARKRIAIAVAALLFGLISVLLLSSVFTKPSNDQGVPAGNGKVSEVYYEGTITYISSSLYPEDRIGYALTDTSGDQIILLKSDDEMLVVSEGLNARLYGEVSYTKDGKNKVLLVDRVVISNVSD